MTSQKIFLLIIFLVSHLTLSQSTQTIEAQSVLGLGTLETVAYSPNGETLATAGGQGIVIWDISTGKVQKILESSNYLTVLAFSTDGDKLISGSKTGEIDVWDVQATKLLHSFSASESKLNEVILSPKNIFSASDDGNVSVHSLEGELLQTLEHTDKILSLTLNTEKSLLATGSRDGSIAVWDTNTFDMVANLATDGLDVYSLAFNESGLVAGSYDGQLRFWELDTQEATKQELHDQAILTLEYTPDYQYLFTGGQDGTVKVWQFGTEETILEHPASVVDLALSPDGKYITVAWEDGYLGTWAWRQGKQIAEYIGYSSSLESLAVGKEGVIIAGNNSGKVWQWQNGELKGLLQENEGSVLAMALSPNGDLLASGGQDKLIHLTNLKDQSKTELAGHLGNISSLAFDTEGKYLYSASSDYTLKKWLLADNTIEQTFSGHSWFISSLALAKEGKLLISGSLDETIKLWDTNTGELKESLQVGGNVTSLTTNGDGSIFAAAVGKQAIVWDLEELEPIHKIDLEKSVSEVALSPNNKLLAIAELGGTLSLWEVEAKQKIATLVGHNFDITVLVFKSERLISAAKDGTVCIWAVDIED